MSRELIEWLADHPRALRLVEEMRYVQGANLRTAKIRDPQTVDVVSTLFEWEKEKP